MFEYSKKLRIIADLSDLMDAKNTRIRRLDINSSLDVMVASECQRELLAFYAAHNAILSTMPKPREIDIPKAEKMFAEHDASRIERINAIAKKEAKK